MYEAHWGLREKPFENTPDPRFLYYSQEHKEALARLLYVVRERKGGGLLTGEYGSGKTLLNRVLWQELQQENKYQSVFILNPRLTGIEFIQEIVHQLSDGSAEITSNKIDLFHILHKILYTNHNMGRHSVIMIDEAQAIQDNDTFEELRLLLNFQMEDAFLLTILLFGQPELKVIVNNMPQLTQRMAVRYHLSALNEQETTQYVQHRLMVAGAKNPVFDEAAHRKIYSFSLGIPRKINTVCDLALLVGYGNGLRIIDEQTVLKIAEDLQESNDQTRKIGHPAVKAKPVELDQEAKDPGQGSQKPYSI
jgi:general secretion pathway protein A